MNTSEDPLCNKRAHEVHIARRRCVHRCPHPPSPHQQSNITVSPPPAAEWPSRNSLSYTLHSTHTFCAIGGLLRVDASSPVSLLRAYRSLYKVHYPQPFPPCSIPPTALAASRTSAIPIRRTQLPPGRRTLITIQPDSSSTQTTTT